ncbi:MAG: dac [Phycisphaerales bacterium]|nr:dac [Phycisphaerales bacterium]
MKLLTRVVCWMGWAAMGVGGTPAIVRADLASDVQVVLQDKLLHKATVGIEVYRLGKTDAEVKEIYNLHADVPLIPASNLKLATSSAALDRLGPDFRFRTALLMHDGDLILIGDGDPTFGDAEYLKKAGWKVTTVFQNWAEQLKKLNVTSVRNVIVDDGIFDESFAHPRWPARQYTSRFEAEVAGMNLNANCVDFTVQPTAPGQAVAYAMDPATAYVTVKNGCVTGNSNSIRLDRKPEANDVALGGETPGRGFASVSITVHDAPMFAATVLAETVAGKGIKFTGEVKRDRTQRQQREKAGAAAAGWTIVGIHETPILPVLARCNKDSMNLYAESLCKRLGYESTHAPGSWESGTASVGAFLKKAGVPEAEFKLDDGSGLSRADVISPHGLARVLTFNFYGKNHDLFFSTLSVAGVDGTLDDRFRHADVRDLRRRVVGKSGFIEGVSTISGYLKARDEQWYAFSIMMNGIPRLSNSEIKQLQEKIIKAVDTSTLSASVRG